VWVLFIKPNYEIIACIAGRDLGRNWSLRIANGKTSPNFQKKACTRMPVAVKTMLEQFIAVFLNGLSAQFDLGSSPIGCAPTETAP